MYTIRQILGTTLGLTVSGVKNMPEAQKSTSEVTDSFAKAQDLLKKIKDNRFDFSELGELQALLKDVKEKNDANKAKILSLLEAATQDNSGYSALDKADLKKIKDEWIASYTTAEKAQTDKKTEVQTTTSASTAKAAEATSRENGKTREFKNTEYKVEKDASGAIKLESMSAVIADFDAMSGIEVENRGVLRQALFGGGTQKEVIGEKQVHELLSRMSKTELDQTYARVTGDATGLPWTSKVYREGKSMYDLDWDAQKKIIRFQREIADQAGMMADLSEAFLGKGARMWLTAVLDGKTDILKAAIANPDKVQDFKKIIVDSKVLERDPNYLTKVVSFLVKVGIQVPLSIMSQGVLGAYVESKDMVVKPGTDKDASKLDATTEGSLTVGEGSKDGKELSATIDLLGVRLNAKWNSITARITGLTDAMIESKDFVGDAKKLTEAMNKSVETTDKDGKKKELYDQVQILSKSYLDRVTTVSQQKILPEKQKEIIANTTMSYLTRVEWLKWARLEGVFAAFNSAGWMIGLSGGITDTAASFSGVREGAARVEADALKKTLSPAELKTWLDKAGVTEKGGVYTLPDGKSVSAKDGQEIVWSFDEMITDTGIKVVATPRVMDKKSSADAKPAVAGVPLQMKRDKVSSEIKWDLPDDKKMSDYLLSLRRTKTKEMGEINRLIAAENYELAKTNAIKLLEGSKDKTGQVLLNALKDPKQDITGFLDLWLEKTSGGGESRKLADTLNSGKTVDIESYYKKGGLAKVFAEQYGISEADVVSIVKSYGTLAKSQINTLGNKFGDGFQALVAYAQKGGFRGLDAVKHSGAQYIGEPREQSGDIAKKLAEKVQNSFSEADIAAYKKYLPEALQSKVSSREMSSLLSTGELPQALKDAGYTVVQVPKIYTYLSFSSNAECFNLGVVAVPPVLKTPDTAAVPATLGSSAQHTVGTGTLVGTWSNHYLGFGVGVGAQWDKPEKKEPEKDDGGDDDGGNWGWNWGWTDKPKPDPVNPKPKPETSKPVDGVDTPANPTVPTTPVVKPENPITVTEPVVIPTTPTWPSTR